MAEIKIKKKKPIWPWILLGVIILALLFFLFMGNDDDDDDVKINDGTDDIEMVEDDTLYDDDKVYDGSQLSSDNADSKISAYKTYISNDKMGIDHEYSNAALFKLIDATGAVANSINVDIKADLEAARADAKSITKDPYQVDHADKIRSSGAIIVKAMKTMQSEEFPALENSWSELESALMTIKPDSKTLEQKSEVKTFFDKAGELLTNMKNR